MIGSAITEELEAVADVPASSEGATGGEPAVKSDEGVAKPKKKTTVIEKLKRLTSTDGKGKGKAKDDGEATIEDILAVDSTPVTQPRTGKVPGTNTLSRRIQIMLSNVPPFLNTLPDDSTASPAPSTSATLATSPSPAAPLAPPLTDARLLSYLANTHVMNGNSKDQAPKPGQQKKSVWQILDQLVPYKPPVASLLPGDVNAEAEASDSSLMVIGPLVPTNDSKVWVST